MLVCQTLVLNGLACSTVVDIGIVSALASEIVEPVQIYKLFGLRLSDARAIAKLTQNELAQRAGMSRASIANIEAGRQRVLLHQIIELTDALRMTSATDLFLVDLLRPSQVEGRQPKLLTTGSRITQKDADDIARIFASS